MARATPSGWLCTRWASGLLLVAGLVLASSTPAGAGLVSLKPIQICDDGGAGCGNAGQKLFEAEGDKIWAQAGLDLLFLPWGQINETDYLDITIGNAAVIHAEAQAVMTAGVAINDPAVTKAINMFFAPTLDSNPGLYGVGCGGSVFAASCNNQVGIFIADNVFSFNGGVGRLDTIAHELGHVLNLTHEGGGDQLMASGGVRSIPGSINDIVPDGAALDKLTQAQIDTALSSPFVTPEPGTVALTLLGVGVLAVEVRRHRRKV